ncbi:hypothetical protein OsI_14823 [Oryza sativa Indica Group]|uniref:Uncharacterized protein n=1 Tax=Oryza sativa subsp. indica TaxID=39946 RepID=B8AV13_ORYSI|nr:hypothetical protein OsI_14823 [Oryza sativa Indica Group]
MGEIGAEAVYLARPMEGGVGAVGEEPIGVEEGAQAAKHDANGDRRRDARPHHRRVAPPPPLSAWSLASSSLFAWSREAVLWC